MTRSSGLVLAACLGFAACFALGCAPSLSEPERFEADGVCDFDVQQDLLVPRCARSSCHVPEAPAAGLEYVSGGLADRLLGVPSTTCGGRLRVDPDDLDNSWLLERLRPDPMCEGEDARQMPASGPALDEMEIECVRQWLAGLTATPLIDGGVIPPRMDSGPRSDSGPRPDAGPPMDSGPPVDAGGLVRVAIEAESMTLTGYMIDGGDANVIRLPATPPTGTATATFSGASGMYMVSIEAIQEDDGAPMAELLIDGTSVLMMTYPMGAMGTGLVPFTIGPTTVMVNNGDSIEIQGASDMGAWARVDRVVFRP